MSDHESRQARIRELVAKTSLTVEEATFAIDLADGRIDSDIGSPDRRLTDEERRALGLGRSLLDDLQLPTAKTAVR